MPTGAYRGAMSSKDAQRHPDPGHHHPLDGAAEVMEEVAEEVEARPWSLMSTQWRLVAPADVLSVAVLVVFGRLVGNDGGPSLPWAAAPFAIALVLCWTVVQVGWRPLERAWPAGVLVWAGTSLAALVMRSLLLDQATSTDFTVMTVVLLAAFMLGWRVLYRFGRAHDHMTPRAVQRRRDAGR